MRAFPQPNQPVVSPRDTHFTNKRSRRPETRSDGSAFATSSLGDLGVGPVSTIPATLRSCGVEPATVLKGVGLAADIFDDTTHRMSFRALGRLLEACVTATGKPHFGLLTSAQFDLPLLGPLGYLVRNETTVRAALRTLALYLHVHTRGAVITLDRVDVRLTALSYAVYAPETPAAGLIYDTALMIGHRIMKTLCGPGWKAREVCLARVLPADPRRYHQMFEAPVRFNVPLSALVFESHWLDRPVPGADPALHRMLTQMLNALSGDIPNSLSDRIRPALGNSVLAGTADAAHIAELFSLSERSLRRHLAREGVALHELISEARLRVTQQLLEQTGMSLRAISGALNYSDPSALSRAFRGWTGLAPSEWRRRHAQPEVDATATLKPARSRGVESGGQGRN
jgi:AraC-like DNA-binding protein